MKLEKPHYMPGQELEDGTLYVGIINDGKDVYHLSVEKNDYSDKEMTWHEAIKIAALPTIQEMNLISANARALGLGDNNNRYWSSTENTSNTAWDERFSDGNQNPNNKTTTYYVRCVRKYLIIQSFDHLKSEISELKEKIKLIEDKINGKI